MSISHAEIEAARKRVVSAFPFPAYIATSEEATITVARTISRVAPPGASILDFGSGPMDKTAVLQLLGYRCTAFDDLGDYNYRLPGVVEKIVNFAQFSGVDFRFELPAEPGEFDVAMMLDVIEHLHDSPRELLNDLLLTVKPEGHLLITVPNAASIRKRAAVMRGQTNLPRFPSFYWSNGAWRGHVREYVRTDLLQLAEYLGLRIVELKSVHHMTYQLPRGLRPVYRAVTALGSGLRDSWLLLAQKPAQWTPRRSVSDSLSQDSIRREMATRSSWGGVPA